MQIKELKLKFYRWSAEMYPKFDKDLIVVFILYALFIIKWCFFRTSKNETNTLIILSIPVLLLFFFWVTVWGWYSIWFRYIAYGIAQIISGIRKIFGKRWIKLILLLAFIHAVQYLRYIIVNPRKTYTLDSFDWTNFLKLAYVGRTFILMIIILFILTLFRMRKRIHVDEFINFTGSTDSDKKLEAAIKGISHCILNEMGRVSKLLKDIDDIQPESDQVLNYISLDIHEFSRDLNEITDTQLAFTVGTVLKIPVGPIFNFFSRLMHGPNLSGSIHIKGDNLMLNAQLKGGKYDAAWSIQCDEIESPTPISNDEKILKMTEILVFKIIAYLGISGSLRWKAVKYYKEGISLYRESTRAKGKSIINLIKAKDAFGLAFRNDSDFIKCYYNLGIIYQALSNMSAAVDAFRNTLKSNPADCHCYFQLAHIYYQNRDFSQARWFCEQALSILNWKPKNWNLLGNINYLEYKIAENNLDSEDYYTKEIKIPKEIVHNFMNASMTSWRALCKSIATGEKLQESKEVATICIRNLAKIKGMRKERKSAQLFRQALFLDSNNNDLHFELGQYHYRQEEYAEAYSQFQRTFEGDSTIDAPFCFWILYLSANILSKKSICDNELIIPCFQHIRKYLFEELEELKFNSKQGKIAAREIHLLIISLVKINEGYQSVGTFYKKMEENSTIQRKLDLVQRHWKTERQTAVTALTEIIEALSNKKITIDKFQKPNIVPPPATIAKLNPDILNIGEVKKCLDKRDYIQALKYARAEVKVSPYHSEIRKMLGQIYIALKDYRQALDELKICYNIDPPKRISIINDIFEAYIQYEQTMQGSSEWKIIIEEAISFFEDTLKIMNDKSFTDEQENYFENLAQIHSYLETFHSKLSHSHEANYHSNIAHEMMKQIEASKDQSKPNSSAATIRN